MLTFLKKYSYISVLVTLLIILIMFYLKERAFQNYVQTHRADLNHKYIDPLIAMSDFKAEITNLLRNNTVSSRIRFIICLSTNFKKYDVEGNCKFQNFYFCSNAERLLSNHQINEKVNSAFQKINNSIEDFLSYGSGWVIDNVDYIDLHIGKYSSIRGGCSNVSLPQSLKNKKAILNVKCENDMCFVFSVLAGMFPQENNKNKEYTYRKFLKRIHYRFLNFPLKVSEIKTFEKRNRIKINVFGFKKEIYPIYVSRAPFLKEIDLLLYENHYFLIKNFNRLLFNKKGIHKFCKNCLLGFQRESTLNDHKKRCVDNAPRKVILPSGSKSILKFNAFQKSMPHPFCVYADFESKIKKVSSSNPNPKNSFSISTSVHIPACYSLILVDGESNIVFHKFYCGKDVVENFLKTLKRIEKCVMCYMKQNIPMNKGNYINSSVCHLCGKTFSRSDIITINHDHLTGKILGSACQNCNLNYKRTYFLPVVIHNLSGYDSHFIFKKITSHLAKKMSIIPNNSEKFTSFSIDNIKFIDSYLFLPAKLSNLIENLKHSNFNFPIFNSYFCNYEKNRPLLLRKGVFPYNYFDSFEKLKTENLPPKEQFFDNLTKSNITREDYKHACHVYKKFKCSTFKDYLKLYLDCDVVLLADIFENFRKLSLNYFQLDPVHFLTTPNLTWYAGLKMTGITLHLLTDVDMYLTIESGMRGGICQVSKRYSIANNPYLNSRFHKSLPRSYIVSLDVNNLYGAAMAFNKLPYSDFTWLLPEEIKNFDIQQVCDEGEYGYILVVDLIYPKSLHNLHKDLPMAPEHKNIRYEMLSPFQKELLKKLGLKQNSKIPKLLTTLTEKQNYVVHYRNLKFYIKHGLKIKKIHKILQFKQSYWLKSYINFNNKKRQESKNDFDKNFFKLMNNSFFGRTCMNVRKHINVKVALNKSNCLKYLQDPGLDFFSILNETTVLFKNLKSNLYLNQPIYIGFTVLELSKLHMYELFYDVFKEHYNENVSLLYMDTDSLTLEIITKDLYKDLKYKFADVMDFSNYDKNHELYCESNKGKLGLLKDECRGIPIEEFCALRPKMYSYIYGQHNKKTAKGVRKSVIENEINHKMYVDVLKHSKTYKFEQTGIISKKHTVSNILTNKTSLSCFYDKMYLKNFNECTPFGHCENL